MEPPTKDTPLFTGYTEVMATPVRVPGCVHKWMLPCKNGSMLPCIVVFVQGLPIGWYNNSKDGTMPVEDVIIRDLIPHIDNTYRTINRREARGIDGMSMGGYGSLHLGFKYPNYLVWYPPLPRVSPPLKRKGRKCSCRLLKMIRPILM